MKRDRTSQATDESGRRLARLEAEARHAGDRFRLYRARSRGPSATSPGRLHELEGERDRAEQRYRRALETSGSGEE
jgi:hypothetical protein